MAKSNAVPKSGRDAGSAGKTEVPPLQSIAGGGAPMGLDRIIHERIRLAIVSALAVNAALSFNDLKRLLGTSDGNLSVHARKLEEAGYLTCTKQFEGRIPRTEYSLTGAGRKALQRYLDHMEALIQATRTRPKPR